MINADGLSIGPHPYEDLRDEGELAVLDIDAVVVSLNEPEVARSWAAFNVERTREFVTRLTRT